MFAGQEDNANDLPLGAALGICIDTAANLALLNAAPDGSRFGIELNFRAYSNDDSATGTQIETWSNHAIQDVLSRGGLNALQTAGPNEDHTTANPIAALSPQAHFPPFAWDEVDIFVHLPVAGLTDVGVWAFSRAGDSWV